jgi:hypothetical protein
MVVAMLLGMMTTFMNIIPTTADATVVLVVGGDFHSRRRIEFLIRMAGYDSYGVRDELEAVNWLRTISAAKPAALVTLPSHDLKAHEVLRTTASVQMQIPMIGVTLAASNPGKTTASCLACDFTSAENQLLATLRSVVIATIPGETPGANVIKERKTMPQTGGAVDNSPLGNRSTAKPLQPAVWLQLSGIVGKSDIELLFPSIIAALKLQERIIIDGREIDSIDLEAISALCGIHRHVVGRGQTLHLEGVRPGMLDEAIAGNRGFAPWTACSIKDKASCLWARN